MVSDETIDRIIRLALGLGDYIPARRDLESALMADISEAQRERVLHALAEISKPDSKKEAQS